MIAGSANKRRIGRLPIFALSRPRNLGSFFFFLFLSSYWCPLPPVSRRSPMILACRARARARAPSETHLNSFRFTSSFRFFCQIFTDLGFFARRRPRNRRDFFSRLSAEMRRFPQFPRRVLRMPDVSLETSVFKQNCQTHSHNKPRAEHFYF